jgi:predicted  nucleic acid-binding Zn-ribbon protein
MERMNELHSKQIESIKMNHLNEMKSKEAIYNDKIKNIETKYNGMLSISQLTKDVNACTSNMSELTKKVNDNINVSYESRIASLDARESIIAEMEKNIRDTKKRSDDEYARLQSMIATLEVTQNRLTTSTNEDRIRLREEHARLEASQVSLETERTVVRNGLSKERDDLRKEKHQFDALKRGKTEIYCLMITLLGKRSWNE